MTTVVRVHGERAAGSPAEAGEEFTITVAGRPVARLGPGAKRRWVGGPALRGVFETPAPDALAEDLERLPATLTDPFG
ncbi:MAG: hypothetical protein WB771_05535 [Solirubrobacterales bacterium]